MKLLLGGLFFFIPGRLSEASVMKGNRGKCFEVAASSEEVGKKIYNTFWDILQAVSSQWAGMEGGKGGGGWLLNELENFWKFLDLILWARVAIMRKPLFSIVPHLMTHNQMRWEDLHVMCEGYKEMAMRQQKGLIASIHYTLLRTTISFRALMSLCLEVHYYFQQSIPFFRHTGCSTTWGPLTCTTKHV